LRHGRLNFLSHVIEACALALLVRAPTPPPHIHSIALSLSRTHPGGQNVNLLVRIHLIIEVIHLGNDAQGTCPHLLSSELAAHRAVKARFWPWFQVKVLETFQVVPSSLTTGQCSTPFCTRASNTRGCTSRYRRRTYVYLSIYLSISIYLFIYIYIYLSIYLSVFLSISTHVRSRQGSAPHRSAHVLETCLEHKGLYKQVPPPERLGIKPLVKSLRS